MKINSKIIAIIAAFAVAVSSVCLTVYAMTIYQQDGFDYSMLNENTVSVCGWDNRDPSLDIPKELGGYYVAEIDDTAFKDNTVITSVSFSRATQLERIGLYAFNGCTSLGGELVIAGKIKTVDTSAFESCTSLESVSFYSTRLTKISAQCFYGCTSLTTVLLPNSLQTIYKYAFADCPVLNSVTIPNSVSYIDPTAFDNDDQLVINCYTGSYAKSFAEENGYDYVLLDAPLPTEQPTDPPTEAPTDPPTEPEPQGYLLGDTDNDDNVDVVDATWVQRAVAEMDINPVEATVMQGNVDGDDLLTVIDATFIMRYTVNIATPYAIGERVV